MTTDNKENTLLLGNGFSKALFKNIPSWDSLFESSDLSIENNTIRYEVYRLQKEHSAIDEADFKSKLIETINAPFSESNLKNDILDIDKFGEYLILHRIFNIITTNYDTGVEFILTKSGYEERVVSDLKSEGLYSIRTYRMFYNAKTLHTVKLWKIHGDTSRVKSITLGFDQYCGSLAKLSDYVKGNYSSDHYPEVSCKTNMKEKCKNNVFDRLSWAELFFNTNVYIVGFGMDFAEIDIWWLINKRARFKKEGVSVNNMITYLYNPQYDTKEKMGAIFAALDAFDVVCKPIRTGSSYFEEVFDKIQYRKSFRTI